MRAGVGVEALFRVNGEVVVPGSKQEERILARVAELGQAGLSAFGIAEMLNQRRVRTRTGNVWMSASVEDLLQRVGGSESSSNSSESDVKEDSNA